MKVWKLVDADTLVLETSEPTQLTEQRDVKVKIEQMLVATSDYNKYHNPKGKYPMVLGRNAIGVVSDVLDKDNSLLAKMDRVVIEPYIQCGNCEECNAEDYANCSDMQELGNNCDGLMRDFVDLPYNILHRLPDNLSDEKALFTSYVAFCLSIIDSLKVERGRHVAVFSSTKTGIILSQLISYYQAVPILISNNQPLLDMAQSMGVFYTLNSTNCDVEEQITSFTGGRMCKELVLFADSDYSMKDVCNSASVNATVCIAGNAHKDCKISFSQITQKHLKVFGVYNGVGYVPSAINMLVTNTVNVEPFIGEKFSFADADKEMSKIQEGELVLKSKIMVVD